MYHVSTYVRWWDLGTSSSYYLQVLDLSFRGVGKIKNGSRHQKHVLCDHYERKSWGIWFLTRFGWEIRFSNFENFKNFRKNQKKQNFQFLKISRFRVFGDFFFKICYFYFLFLKFQNWFSPRWKNIFRSGLF